MVMCSRRMPSLMKCSAQAMPLAPAPLKTALMESRLLPVISAALSSAAPAMLVVVEDGDFQRAAQFLLDLETFRGTNVFEVDTAEGGLQNLAGADDFLGILGVEFDIENVDVRESLKQHSLTFHDGFAGHGADVAESEDGGAVGDDGNQVALRGVLIDFVGILFNFQARNGDAGRIGKAQVALCTAGFGRNDSDLPWRR
jgi:hypothetical protein